MEKQKTKQEKEEKSSLLEKETSKTKVFDSSKTESFGSARNSEEFRHAQKSSISDTSERKEKEKVSVSCADKQCPFHGKLRLRGRSFKGYVVSKNVRRVCIEFERIVYVKKFERYMKKKTKIHARLPDCLKDEINIGNYIEVKECRPLSKIIHFAVVRKVRSKEEGKSGGEK